MSRRNDVLTAVATVVAAVALALAAGCSTELDSPSDAPVNVGGTVGASPLDDDAAPGGTLLAPGEDDPILDTPVDQDPIDTDSTQQSELGGCSVKLTIVTTGEVSDEWQVAATDESFAYGGWYTQNAREEAATDSIVLDDSYFQLMCRGVGERSISFTGNTRVPQRPATYRLTLSADGTAQSPRDRITAVLSLPDTGLLRVGAEGAFTITDFDDVHIAGSFDVPFVDTRGVAVRATGTFDFARPPSPPPVTAPPTTG